MPDESKQKDFLDRVNGFQQEVKPLLDKYMVALIATPSLQADKEGKFYTHASINFADVKHLKKSELVDESGKPEEKKEENA